MANKKIFISDPHLGDGSKSDDFHRDGHLIALFDRYVDGNKIYLLGDIFELWQARLDKIIWAHLDVFKYLEDWNITCIYGNHDFLPFSKLWPETYEDELIYAEHGHQHDVYNNVSMFNLKWPIGKYITLGVGWLERLWNKDVDEFLLKKYGEFKYTAAKLQGAVKSGVNNWPAYYGVIDHKPHRIYICGHTHKPLLYKSAGDIYANCGAWVDSVLPTYLLVDGNTVQLRNGLDYSIINEEKL